MTSVQTVRQVRDRKNIDTTVQEESELSYSRDSVEALASTENRHFWSQIKHRLVARLMRRYLRNHSFEHLDLGCGSGGMLKHLAAEFSDSTSTGIDGYTESLDHARRNAPDARLLLCDITQIEPTAIGSAFDVITCLDVLEHIEEPEHVLQSVCQKLLRDDGIIIVTVPASNRLWSERDVFLGHYRRYTKQSLGDLMSAGGFEIIHMSYLYSYLWAPVYFSRKVIGKLRGLDGQRMEESELKVVPVVNQMMLTAGLIEIWLSTHWGLPFGTSVYCVARKR